MAGVKTWVTRDRLYAADVDEYLMGQAVPRFPSTGDRDAAIPTPDDGQLCWVVGAGGLHVGRGGDWVALSFDVRDWGATADGVTDDTEAIQACLDAAEAAGATATMRGTYATTSTLSVMTHLDAADASVAFTGSGVAIQIGPSTPGPLSLKHVVAPKLTNVAKTTTGWAQTGVAGATGIMISNCYACSITTPFVVGFETGVTVSGTGSFGCCFNEIRPVWCQDNKTNLRFTADSTGVANQNTFIGGKLAHSSSEGSAVAGVTHVLMDDTTHPINNNTFVGTDFEGAIPQYSLDIAGGIYNVWINCRWEASNGIRWGAHATGNMISGGYGAFQLAQTFVAGQSFNSIVNNYVGGSRPMGGTYGEVVANEQSANYPLLTIMPPGAIEAGTSPATGYAAKLAATIAAFKNTGDSYDRYSISNNGIKLGPGNVAQPITLAGDATYFLIAGGPIGMYVDNTQDIGATATKRPRTIYAGTDVVAARAVKVGSYTTAGRPAAATVGAGAMIFDTTLGYPVWSTGSVYVNAAGTTV